MDGIACGQFRFQYVYISWRNICVCVWRVDTIKLSGVSVSLKVGVDIILPGPLQKPAFNARWDLRNHKIKLRRLPSSQAKSKDPIVTAVGSGVISQRVLSEVCFPHCCALARRWLSVRSDFIEQDISHSPAE